MPRSTLASRLKHRVSIEAMQRMTDNAGGYSTSWSTVDSVWAEIVPFATSSTSHERLSGGQLEARTRHKITMRYRSDVTAEMRFVLGNRVFNIRSIINPKEADEMLSIIAEEGVE